jgi:hypothetical protein
MIGMPVNRGGAPVFETFCSLWVLKEAVPHVRFVASRGGLHTATGRNMLLVDFLKSDATHLFHVDADMVFKPVDFVRVLALATKLPVVLAVYREMLEQQTMDEYGTISAHSGLGFCCVQRRVIEALVVKASWGKAPDGTMFPRVYRFDETELEDHGEDILFFRDCEAAGFPVRADPSIELGHMGEKEFRGRMLDLMERIEADPLLEAAE